MNSNVLKRTTEESELDTLPIDEKD